MADSPERPTLQEAADSGRRMAERLFQGWLQVLMEVEKKLVWTGKLTQLAAGNSDLQKVGKLHLRSAQMHPHLAAVLVGFYPQILNPLAAVNLGRRKAGKLL